MQFPGDGVYVGTSISVLTDQWSVRGNAGQACKLVSIGPRMFDTDIAGWGRVFGPRRISKGDHSGSSSMISKVFATGLRERDRPSAAT